jgi:isopentenyldiphosphate isomerase
MSSANHNPHALTEAQSLSELFEIMNPPSENFNPYTDHPESTNSYETRAEAHSKGLWHCSVHIWIVKTPSSILLQKRSMKKDTFPGRWDISSAGHIEAGKSPLEAAHSEIAEELGIDLKSQYDENNKWNGGLQYAFTIPAEQAPIGGCNAFEHVYFLVLDEKSELKLSLGTEEVTEVAWMECESLMESLRAEDEGFAPRTKRYVDALEKYINTLFDKNDVDVTAVSTVESA